MPDGTRPLVLLCAGGTGGHLFPAESLAVVLAKRGVTVDLATDVRAAHFQFPAREVHLIPSATVRGRDPLSLLRTASMLARGTLKAWSVIGRIRPAVVVGFGPGQRGADGEQQCFGVGARLGRRNGDGDAVRFSACDRCGKRLGGGEREQLAFGLTVRLGRL